MTHVTTVPHAAGATRLLVSPNGLHAVAEIRAWLRAEYGGYADHVPGLLKLLGADRKLVKPVTGWPLGPPDDTGTLLYVEEAPHEYQYRVVSSERDGLSADLEPPDGYWHVKATLGAPEAGCAVVVLWSPVPGHDWSIPLERRERLWIASIDRFSLRVIATRELEATTPMLGSRRFDIGITLGANGGAATIGLVEIPDVDSSPPTWHVSALDCRTLNTRWRVALPVFSTIDRQNDAQSDEKITETFFTPAPTAGDERVTMGAVIAVAGDGRHLAVVYGSTGRASISAKTIYVLDSKSGEVVGKLIDVQYPVASVVPVAGTPSVALLHTFSVRLGGDGARSTEFSGVSVANLATQRLEHIIDPSSLLVPGWDDPGSMLPLALSANGQDIDLAPSSFDWVEIHDKDEGRWPTGTEVGARSPEVEGWLALPLEWHRPDRDAVKKHDKWMNNAREHEKSS